MKLVADLHVHTVSSGHAYSTVLEIAQYASTLGLPMLAITDHGPAMPGAPHDYHFGNMRIIPDELFGVRILKGIEANVIDRKGTLDLEERRLAMLDVVAAGLHTFCTPNGSKAENTELMIEAIKNPLVQIITHPGNPEFLIDEAAVVQAAVHYDVALEVNNSSLTTARKGSRPRCSHIVSLAKAYGATLVVGSDSHFAYHVGRFDAALELLAEHDFPEEQVLNTSIDKIMAHIRKKRRA